MKKIFLLIAFCMLTLTFVFSNSVKVHAAVTVDTLVSSGLSYPNGVAVDSSGNVYISDPNYNAIKEWNKSSGTVTTLVSSGLSCPTGIAVDSSGNVYIADRYSNAIKKITVSASASSTTVPLTAGKGLVRIMTGKPQYANAKIPFVIDAQSFSKNITGYSVDIIYDSAKVEAVTVDSSNGLTKPTVGAPVNADGSNKKVTVTWNGTFTGQDLNSIYDSSKGVLFKLNFVANQDFKSGETPIEIGTGSFTFASGVSSSVTGINGKIISGLIYGDVNGDGAITSSDTNLINKYVSGKATAISGEANLIAADVNGDGSITAADAKEISNYISGKASTLKTLFGY